MESPHPFPMSCELAGLAGLGLLAGGQLWNNEAERAGTRSGRFRHEQRAGEGAPLGNPIAPQHSF